ncbi:MAG: C-terminal binding protein [Paracoccaceae bacterium]
MTDAVRVVVTDATFPGLDAEFRAAEAAGAVLERKACKTVAEVAEAVAGAQVAVVQFAPLTYEAIAGLAPGATVIRYGVGYNNFDIAALNEFGIRAAYVPDYCTVEVADHTAASILSLLRKLQRFDASVRAGDWDVIGTARPIKAFADTVVGFLGFGRIAEEVAARLRPFGLQFAALDPFLTTPPPGVRMVELDALLAESDCISLHAPSTEDTQGIIDAQALRAMKSTAYLVNSARGDLIDENALAAALSDGEIAGAAIDVFRAEPLPAGNPLRIAPNLQLTPHAAWYSDTAIERLQAMVADEITRALTGQPVRRPVPGTTN